jgi:hypothetical protein
MLSIEHLIYFLEIELISAHLASVQRYRTAYPGL